MLVLEAADGLVDAVLVPVCQLPLYARQLAHLGEERSCQSQGVRTGHIANAMEPALRLQEFKDHPLP